jgi:hypothetical protein
MPSVDELIAVKEQVEARFMGQPGVTGIDVGYKEVGGQRTDQIAIRVHVEAKRDDVPDDQRVPAEIDGAVTDVLVRTYELQVVAKPLEISAQADTTHYATISGGISMGPSRVINGSIFAGTLGAVVTDNVTNQRAALTNFHVACVDNTFSNGDRMVQPSRIDTGVVPADEFGALLRESLSAAVDGAIISIDAGRATACEVVEIGPVRGTRTATLGMVVRKRGRTTGLTHGSVDGIAGTVNVDYGDGIGVRTLTNQISIAADTTQNPLFSDHGDSGSVIVDDAGFVVGLLFAGAGTSTVANQIASVLAELNIAMCVGKSLIKDIKDGRKDFIKDKDKEFRKELIKEIRKEFVLDNKLTKDIRDRIPKRVTEGPPGPGPDPGPLQPGPGFGGQAGLEQRLAAIESQLGQLTGFIGADLRPDLSGSAFSAEPELSDAEATALRAEIERQVTEAAAAKAELDGPYS